MVFRRARRWSGPGEATRGWPLFLVLRHYNIFHLLGELSRAQRATAFLAGGLSARDFDALRQGSREKVPAEYRDLVNRYFKALSERGTGGR